jgi:LmbE family N-acetylglucosaminyl deacetylase
MADLDDGPDQTPLPAERVRQTILDLLPRDVTFDVILTHGPDGEYTRHARHEECSRAVIALWGDGRIRTRAVWCFAYDDGHKAHLPRVSEHAGLRQALPESVWEEKYRIVTTLYGFTPDSWEARVTPREEGFLCFDSPEAARRTAANQDVA